MQDVSGEVRNRLDKVARMREEGVNPYPDRFERSHSLLEASRLDEGATNVRIAGRVTALKKFGKLSFAFLSDIEGRMQISVQKGFVSDEALKVFKKYVDVGDFVGVEGEIIRTKTGELTVRATELQFLSKAIRPLPEKWHGLRDPELRQRQRYLDLVANEDSRERFLTRTKITRLLRRHFEEHAFYEVDTPVLQNVACGALARPFSTHHNALDLDVFLRIAPETYLKRCIIGGFDRVFEFARCFRNEGISLEHLQDFTIIEFYAAYWNFEDNMAFTEGLLSTVVRGATGGLVTKTKEDEEIDWTPPYPRKTFRDLILGDSGIDIDGHESAATLLAEIKAKKIDLNADEVEKLGRGNLIDLLYKRVSRPRMIQPTFLVSHPKDVSPLARGNDENPRIVDRFQLVVNGSEIINAYSELADPVDQLDRLKAQASLREGGDEEAMEMENDFVTALEYGMPPTSGWGMGLDRFCSLLTAAPSVRDVVLFPLLRPSS